MKRLLQFLLLPGLLLFLAGCSLPFSVSQQVTAGGSEPMGGLSGEQYTIQAAPSPMLSPQRVCLWARSQLTPVAQAPYDRLSAAIACRQEAEVLVESDVDQVQLVLTALRMDHPEYFWFNGEASYVTSSVPLLGETTSCVLTYTMDEAEIQQRLKQVEQYVSECLSSPELTGAETDYEKILGVYRYIIGHTDYVLSSTDQSMIGVMTNRQGTCAGYARTFEYLMHYLNIPCTLALGQGDQGESHGWNIVQCGGQWYHIDVTWGDPVGEDGLPGASLSYTYCMVTDQEIFRDHTLTGDIPMPVCQDTKWNYFRQTGRYLTAWDPEAYSALLALAAAQGESTFSVRFDRQADYQSALDFLIGQGKILDIIKGQGLSIPDSGVTYSQNELFLEFSLQLPS